jgi:predicted permease
MQNVLVTHATPLRVFVIAPATSGLDTTAHAFPFQLSTMEFDVFERVKSVPTAVQCWVVAHETALS